MVHIQRLPKEVVLVYRWFLNTSGGACKEVVLVKRWCLYAGGACIQVVLVYRWSLYTGGACIEWCLHTSGPRERLPVLRM